MPKYKVKLNGKISRTYTASNPYQAAVKAVGEIGLKKKRTTKHPTRGHTIWVYGNAWVTAKVIKV